MDEQPDFDPSSQTYPEPPPPQDGAPSGSMVRGILIGVLGIVVLLAAYGAFAYLQGIWPFQRVQETVEEPGTTSWNTYRNEEFGFEFKYPSDWQVVAADKPLVHIVPPGEEDPTLSDSAVKLSISNESDPKSLPGWWTATTNQVGPFDGVMGTEHPSTREIHVWKDGRALLAQGHESIDHETFLLILSTFRFIESESAQTHSLDCTILRSQADIDSVRRKYTWSDRFFSQIIAGWEVNVVCYNPNTEQVAYIKSVPGLAAAERAQLGVYSIVNDTFDKSPAITDIPLYGDCGFSEDLAPTWMGDTISFGCRGGDAGYVSMDQYAFNTQTKQLVKKEACAGPADDPTCAPGTAPAFPRAWEQHELSEFTYYLPPDSEPIPGHLGIPPGKSYFTGTTYRTSRELGPLLEESCEGVGCYRTHIYTIEWAPFEAIRTRIRDRELPNGDLFDVREGSLNSMRAMSFGVGGMCSGRTLLLFGQDEIVELSVYCADEELFIGIAPTIRMK